MTARHELVTVRLHFQVVGAGPGAPAAAVIHAPIAVLPTPFPRRSFEKVALIAYMLALHNFCDSLLCKLVLRAWSLIADYIALHPAPATV